MRAQQVLITFVVDRTLRLVEAGELTGYSR